ncbi:hypothetical protein WMY93_006631 [Mugilogobius chulae]|uniref:Transmembrane channel-like protein n=1 Tax=Mugilogobius chulae TaxID=88201 RepID=A0AAW0PWV1_9GOBI
MTTVFITLLCIPSFVGASVCVTYTMWSIAPSASCGPFRQLKTMIQAGKRWVEELERVNPNLSVLARAHSYLVEHPFSCLSEPASFSSKRERLVNNLQNLSVGDRERMLRGMPLSLGVKSELRQEASQQERQTQSTRQIPCCSRLKYYIIIAARHGWYSWLSFLHSLQLWQVALKRVSGRFGTGVLSYFIFLKTLLFFNLFLFLVTGAFLVLPQVVHPPDPPPKNLLFTGLELLSGAGYFTDTVMYYGYYCNYTLHSTCKDHEAYIISTANETRLECPSKLSYNMPLAYFFTIGASFFITCIILVMSKSFGQSFRIDKSHSILAMKVFCSWDFKVSKKTSVELMSENICTQIKELLAEVNHKMKKKKALEVLWRATVHGLAWAICIASTVGCAFGIYFFSEYMHKNLERESRSITKEKPIVVEASMLALPVVVSVINLLVPGLFNAAAWMEDYDSPSFRTYVAISRNLMLKMSVLGVLCYHWLGRVAKSPELIGLQCWETFVGQEFYRFLIIDFIFTLLDTLFGEFLWRLGVLFTPILPAVQIIKLFLLFYIKKGSVMMNCQAPRKPYRVSQMTTVFITLLCIPSFVGASVCVTYTMWSIAPSASCGPFRQLKTMIQAGKRWVEELERVNPNLRHLSNNHLLPQSVVDGQRKIINLLQEQIQNEGDDKKWLITRLQSIHEQRRTPARKLTRLKLLMEQLLLWKNWTSSSLEVTRNKPGD